MNTMHIPSHVERVGGNVRFDYIVNFTLLEIDFDPDFNKRFGYNVDKYISPSGYVDLASRYNVNVDQIVSSGYANDRTSTLIELCIAIESINNPTLKNYFISNLNELNCPMIKKKMDLEMRILIFMLVLAVAFRLYTDVYVGDYSSFSIL